MKRVHTKNFFGDLKIEPSNLIGIYGTPHEWGDGLSDDEIINAIQNPIGTKCLSEMAKGCKKVLIVTDDNTRATPLSRILPLVLDELKAGGVTEKMITFLIGLGTHRSMNIDEIKKKYGAKLSDKYRIVNHDWKDSNSLLTLGRCQLGFDVIINKLAQETDLMISVGSIVPHATTGFSGGGKTIIPGICGEKTVEETHWIALNYSMREILGKLNNPIRDAINIICRKVNLRMIINTVLFDEKNIYGIVAGDMESAHRKGVELCKEIYEIEIPEKADIVIADAYPNDIDLRQAIKAICAADIVCRDGGVIILVADCPEGVAPQFPEFAKYGFKNPETLYRDVEKGKFKQKIMAYTLVAIGRIISRRVRPILVSPNIDSSLAENIGFFWNNNLQDAVDRAFQMVGKDSRIIGLQQAGQIVPALPTSMD